MATATAPIRDPGPIMLHRREFPRRNWLPARLLKAFLRHGWRDTSWINDACPTFEKNGTVIFCEAHDRRIRELGVGMWKRYQIVSPRAIDVAAFEYTDHLIAWLEANGCEAASS